MQRPAGFDPIALAHQISSGVDPLALSHQLGANATHGGFYNTMRAAWTGEKFPTGFGATKSYTMDYWELRERSSQLFTDNPAAVGLIRRLITAEIGPGLMPELEPVVDLLAGAMSDEEAELWADQVETKFDAYASTVALVDYEAQRDFGMLQQDARREALIEGDVLVNLRVDGVTGCPQIQLIRGSRVVTPLDRITDRRVVHGVELDKRGRMIAFHVKAVEFGQPSTRIPAFGPRSGKRMAWLLYGTEKRIDAVRGTPLLGLILQSLRELDRFKDSTQRKATVNSLLAMFIERTGPGGPTNPIGGGAVMNSSFATTEPDRDYEIAEQWPGLVMQRLGQGEKPVSFKSNNQSEDFATFNAAILSGIAWGVEMPPEILMLQFGSNYTASKAATAEWQAYVMKLRRSFGGIGFCQPVLCEWLINEVDRQRIAAPGLVESFGDRRRYDEFHAWTRTTWGGPVRPSIELHRDVKAFIAAIDAKLISIDYAAKALFGVRSGRVFKRWLKEQRQIIEMEKELGVWVDPNAVPTDGEGVPVDPGTKMTRAATDKMLALCEDHVEQYLEEREREGEASANV